MRLKLTLLICIVNSIQSFMKRLPIKFRKIDNKRLPINMVPIIFYNSDSNKVDVNIIRNNFNESSDGNSTSVRIVVDPLPTFPPFNNLCKMNFVDL